MVWIRCTLSLHRTRVTICSWERALKAFSQWGAGVQDGEPVTSPQYLSYPIPQPWIYFCFTADKHGLHTKQTSDASDFTGGLIHVWHATSFTEVHTLHLSDCVSAAAASFWTTRWRQTPAEAEGLESQRWEWDDRAKEESAPSPSVDANAILCFTRLERHTWQAGLKRGLRPVGVPLSSFSSRSFAQTIMIAQLWGGLWAPANRGPRPPYAEVTTGCI